MITQTLQKIAELRAQADALEAKVAAARAKELATLPGQYGFDSAADFIAAVTTAAAGGQGQKSAKVGVAAKPAGKKRRKRAVITDATRDEVKKLVLAGKTGGAISKEVGISLPSVQNIKKALGLVGNVVEAKAASEAKPKAAAKPAAKKPKAPAKKKRRTRAVITDATKAEVKKLVDQAKSGKEIAKAVGISLPSVNNIKKELGLVKKAEK
jgi:hypothetical protein